MPKTPTPGLHHVRAKNFAAVPFLETSQLMTTHKGKVKLSTTLPNVLVGPNGSGKSALLTSLSLRTLSHYTGESVLDRHFVTDRHPAEFFSREGPRWANKFVFLAGLECETHNAPALYYRPNHIPGNEKCLTTAMMTGYFELAKAHGRLTDNKSSGQASQALLQRVLDVLGGAPVPACADPGGERARAQQGKSRSQFVSQYDYMTDALCELAVPGELALPLVLMDEPEQSLDALAEARLWKQIERADCSRIQVVVASHSLYPLLHPEKFNLVETVPSYARTVRKELGMS